MEPPNWEIFPIGHAVVVGSFFPYSQPMPHSIDSIIDRLGGADAAARLTGVGTEAVRKWRQAGAIPSRHWPAVIAATGLTLADLPTGETARYHERPPTVCPPGATAALVLADGIGVLGPRLRRPYRTAPRVRWARSASTPA